MTDRDALFRAICAQPDEDTPRLAFADYLDEQGGKENALRAGYIRAAIRLAREELYSPAWQAARRAFEKPDTKIRQRLARGTLEWVKHLKGRARAFEFERGFVGHLTVYSKRFVAEGATFFEQDPIRSVKFVTLTVSSGTVPAAELFACPHLARVARLSLDESGLRDADLKRMGDSPHLAGVKALSLSGHQRFAPPALVSALEKLPAVEELRAPRSPWFDDRFAGALAGSGVLGKLTTLDLEDHDLGAKGVCAILATKHGANLRELRLSVAFEYDEENEILGDRRRLDADDGKAVAGVLRACRFPKLRLLDAAGWHIGDAGLAALVAGGGFPALRQLTLAENDLTPAALKVLADSPVGKQLVYLALGFDAALEKPGVMKKVAAMFPGATVTGFGMP